MLRNLSLILASSPLSEKRVKKDAGAVFSSFAAIEPDDDPLCGSEFWVSAAYLRWHNFSRLASQLLLIKKEDALAKAFSCIQINDEPLTFSEMDTLFDWLINSRSSSHSARMPGASYTISPVYRSEVMKEIRTAFESEEYEITGDNWSWYMMVKGWSAVRRMGLTFPPGKLSRPTFFNFEVGDINQFTTTIERDYITPYLYIFYRLFDFPKRLDDSKLAVYLPYGFPQAIFNVIVDCLTEFRQTVLSKEITEKFFEAMHENGLSHRL
jgi:hypothetical protein